MKLVKLGVSKVEARKGAEVGDEVTGVGRHHL
jgi:hypothetical protein